MAQFVTGSLVNNLLPPNQKKPNLIKFFSWVVSLFEYYSGRYVNADIAIRPFILSGQTGVLLAYCKDYIGALVEIQDNTLSVVAYPYARPFDCRIVVSADATIDQFNAVVELFEFYKLAGKIFVYSYGNPVDMGVSSDYTYFEFGL
jgi:hypothetical protein